MPNKAESYLRNSEECERLARAATGAARAQFLEMAQHWLQLAKMADSVDQTRLRLDPDETGSRDPSS